MSDGQLSVELHKSAEVGGEERKKQSGPVRSPRAALRQTPQRHYDAGWCVITYQNKSRQGAKLYSPIS